MKYIYPSLINILAISLNVPGMLNGKDLCIGAGIFLAVCLGITATLGVITWKAERDLMKISTVRENRTV